MSSLCVLTRAFEKGWLHHQHAEEEPCERQKQGFGSDRLHARQRESDGDHHCDSDSDSDSPPKKEARGLPLGAKQLPEGIRFFLGDAEQDARSEQVAADLQASPDAAGGGTWSAPVLFYSDGTTSTAEVILINDRNDAIRISLRGLTGIATVSDVFSTGGAGP